ncbi:LOW QUALITY PROTEIN: uncharacterized protein LOC104423213 [Eucalyptus grandis]|uniref:LOW QUALITY PROTEIN: uncharacterized protein LOC104423213 n=1 Tax=Eucalyptus grandis TaxID=71139 RepID=UPI00192EAF65|nr:LOW QUALITY PROTEIN: uncharacterized protein LOC104423213 [Eucalyptus grandis]
MVDREDPWLARDKLYHVLFCLSLTLLFSRLASLARPSLLRRRSSSSDPSPPLLAGAAKEAADHLGVFPSDGASAKDALADVLGVLIAASALSLCRRRSSTRPAPELGQHGVASMV